MTQNPVPSLRRLALTAACAAVVTGGIAHAQEPEAALPGGGAEVELSPEQVQALMNRRGSSPAAPDADDFPSADEVTKGMKKVNAAEGETGLFTLYRAAQESDREPAKLLASIPRNLLRKDLLLATSISSGPLFGYQSSDYLVRFEQRGRNLCLMVPDLSNVGGGGAVADAVKQTYRPRILVTLPIKAMNGGDYLVDMTPLTLGTAVASPGARGRASTQLSKYPTLKVFPENVLIDVERVTGGDNATGSGISFSFRELPNLNRDPRNRYTPREADERVGYFLTARQNWAAPHDARDTLQRYINRWDVQKLDPSLEMSPPKEPIVFYIEKTVPVKWRRYVRDGIAEWNKAFEEVGIVNAIEVRQQTDSQYQDIDPADARYNFVRWIVTGRAFAMGPSRVDPRTGQILDADIIFDDSMLRYFQGDIDLLGPKALARDAGPQLREFWAENPAFLPMGMALDDVNEVQREWSAQHEIATAAGSNMDAHTSAELPAEARQAILDLAGVDADARHTASRLNPDAGQCEHAVGMRRQLAVAHLLHTLPATRPADASGDEAEPADGPSTRPADAGVDATASAEGEGGEAEEPKKARSRELPEKYVGLVLKEVVAHEVGHTLGLRHNFKASSWLSLDEIKARRADASRPTVSSVMDYNPVLLFAGDDPEEIETFVTPVLGPYDKWAIEYGYTILGRGQGKKLAEIAGKAGRKELAFATDGEATGVSSPDPKTNRYDMGDDPVAWAKSRIELGEELLANVEEWAVEEGDPNDALRAAFVNLFYEKVGAMNFVTRTIGGQYFSRARFGDQITDGDAPGLTPVPAEEQREALAFLKDTLFADGFFETDADLLNKLVTSRQVSLRGYPGGRIDFPIHQTILNAQNRALSTLTNPTILQRLYDAEVKTTADDKFTAAELIEGVSDAVWTAPEGDGYDSIRRNLQMQHVDYLVALVDSEPGRLMSADVQNMVRYQMRQISGQIDAIDAEQFDLATRAHLTEAKQRIDKVLDAPHMAEGMGGGGGGMIIIMGQQGE